MIAGRHPRVILVVIQDIYPIGRATTVLNVYQMSIVGTMKFVQRTSNVKTFVRALRQMNVPQHVMARIMKLFIRRRQENHWRIIGIVPIKKITTAFLPPCAMKDIG